ncbi:30S ribosomal protein S9 [Plasmodium gonderi]|uniref:30S ribosomal protein S9 n=1 Tax=Plasmodium gonderi TaxID=77519 RepID=A0A1Y1JIW2_PLAGO|nr:30S ribosomal protein S9 [Plasmodium gonderi]GAW81137.1 30S ribosomal protein S9 [Plasmodium gonderi]
MMNIVKKIGQLHKRYEKKKTNVVLLWVPNKYISTSNLKNEKNVKVKVNTKNYILSLDEALYLSKEMGIKTTTEIQKMIMRSPPFSADTSPFLIDNFLCSENRNSDSDDIDQIDQKLKALGEKEENDKKDEKDAEKEKIKEGSLYGADNNNVDILSKVLIEKFNKKRAKTFIHNDMEWLEESEGIGTNKRSCAYVYIRRGSGIVKVNNQEDLYIRWPYFYNRTDVLEPFYLTNTACVFDVFIKLKGGGISGQSKAARLAIGRALLNACPFIYDELKEHDILYEDMRQKFPKMPGRKKSRAMKQWSKR